MQARGVVVGVRVCARTDGACASFPNSTSIMRRVGAVEEEADGSLLPPLLQRHPCTARGLSQSTGPLPSFTPLRWT